MEKSTVSIAFITNALHGIRSQGLDCGSLLRKAGIDPDLLNDPQARVSTHCYSMQLRLIAQVLDDEFFGQDSRRMKVGSYAMMARTAVACRTLEQALDRTMRFFCLVLDDLGITLTRDGRIARLTLFPRLPRQPATVFAYETLLVFLHGLLCWLVKRRIPMLSVGFTYPEPSYAAEYHVMFSSDISFDQPETTVSFDSAYLDLPIVQDEVSLKPFLRMAPENILVKYKNTRSTSARIRTLLRQTPPEDWPEHDTLARDISMSASTLRRRLRDEGQTYQGIKEGLRRDLATGQLAENGKSIMDIAGDLGFADPSAFYRAFKRWTGVSPGEYRDTILNQREK